MSDKEKKQLEFEIRHIFESGENELRIYDMVVNFIEKRYENPLDKSIEQRAEEKIEEIFKKHYMSYGEYDVELIKPELIEYFKACQQNLEVSQPTLTIERVSKMLANVSRETWITVQGSDHGWKEWWRSINKLNLNKTPSDNTEPISERLYTKEEMEKAMLFSFDTFTVAFSRLEIERRIERYLESLPKANS